jgi:S1-C subfamily serine protease
VPIDMQMQQAGVLVAGVAAHTDAFDRGLAPGDVILRMQGADLHSPEEEQAAVDAARAEHKAFILALVLAKAEQDPVARWVALKVVD